MQSKFKCAYENIVNQLGNAYSGSKFLYKNIVVESRDFKQTFYTNFNGDIIDESIIGDWTPADDRKGGIIVFSTKVSAVKQSDNAFIDFIKKQIKSIINYIFAERKIDKIAQKHQLIGWTVGRFLHGRYTGKDGKVYSENSLSVEVIGVTFDELIHIAEEICKVMDQESVLVKDYSSLNIVFVE